MRGKLLLLGIFGISSAGLVVPCLLLKGADGPVIAATPPMGWNSWDSYGTAVREPEVKANADYMAKLPSNDEYTNSLLTDDKVLAVNQKGSHAREAFTSGAQIVWTSNAAGPAKNLAVFNIGDHDVVNIRVDWRSIGLPALCAMRDLWAKKNMGTIRDGYTFNISPHAPALYQVSPAK